jgi:hypothetical protein
LISGLTGEIISLSKIKDKKDKHNTMTLHQATIEIKAGSITKVIRIEFDPTRTPLTEVKSMAHRQFMASNRNVSSAQATILSTKALQTQRNGAVASLFC